MAEIADIASQVGKIWLADHKVEVCSTANVHLWPAFLDISRSHSALVLLERRKLS